MTRFTCVSIGRGPTRVTERVAETLDAVADACATAIHSAYWAERWRQGTDSHGTYCEYAIRAGGTVHSTVRVYETYKY